MAQKGSIDMIGSEANLKPSSPADMRHQTPGIPAGEIQMTGSTSDLNRQGTDMSAFDKHVPSGQMQITGSGAELDRSARRGWQSYETDISINSEPDRGLNVRKRGQ